MTPTGKSKKAYERGLAAGKESHWSEQDPPESPYAYVARTWNGVQLAAWWDKGWREGHDEMLRGLNQSSSA